MAKSKSKSPVRKLLSPQRIFIPIAIGLAVAIWLLWNEFDINAFSKITWGWGTVFWLVCALLMVVARDLGYMYRIRTLTDKEISWRNSFDVIMLWEFASAISPSVVGGSAVAFFIVNKEGISLGRSTTVVMVTAFLDELFYILMVPLVLLFVGTSSIFPPNLQKNILGFSLGAEQIFYVGYGFIVLLTTLILTAIFFAPKATKRFLVKVTFFNFLKFWRANAFQTGNDIIITSKELRGKSWKFWGRAFGATLFSWTARFWVVNFLILALGTLTFNEHMMVYARQLVMWVIMLISPTPGGTGVAEYMFGEFLGLYIVNGFAGVVALFWRLLTYYPYLFIGMLVLPIWIKRVYLKRKLISFKKEYR